MFFDRDTQVGITYSKLMYIEAFSIFIDFSLYNSKIVPGYDIHN